MLVQIKIALQKLSSKKISNFGCDKCSLNRKVRILNICDSEHREAFETLPAWCRRQEDLQLQEVPEEEAELQESSSADAWEQSPSLSSGWLPCLDADLIGSARFNG